MHMYDKYYGSFEVTGNDLRVTDPCYELESTGGITLINVKPGKWFTHAVVVDKQDGWGERVTSLTVVHESYPVRHRPSIDLDCKPVIAVDSGQAGFFDINKYPTDSDIGEKFYDENCRLTLSEEHGGIVFNSGVVTRSGYGDGCYRLYYDMDSDINSNGEIIAAEIVFIEDDDEDEEDDDENEDC